MYAGAMLSFLVITIDEKGQPGDFVSVTFPEGGIGYIDELFGDYVIVATDTTVDDEGIDEWGRKVSQK